MFEKQNITSEAGRLNTTQTRKELERARRKQLILQGAIGVFNTSGIEKATMDQIAKEAGFGKATLYYYFSSKEEIFNSILLEGWRELWTGIEKVTLGTSGPRRTFIRILKNIAERVNANRPLYEFLFFAPRAASSEQLAAGNWKTYQDRLYNVLYELIESGIKENKFPQMDPRLVMKALGGLFHGMLFLGADRNSISETEIEEMLDNLLRKKKG